MNNLEFMDYKGRLSRSTGNWIVEGSRYSTRENRAVIRPNGTVIFRQKISDDIVDEFKKMIIKREKFR
jgi:hypothetical protein